MKYQCLNAQEKTKGRPKEISFVPAGICGDFNNYVNMSWLPMEKHERSSYRWTPFYVAFNVMAENQSVP